jgi:hypothetical protein
MDPFKEGGGRKAVIRGVDAHAGEDLALFFQAVPLESGGCQFPSVEITLFLVKLTKPTFVFPRRGPEIDSALGERSQLGGEGVDLHGLRGGVRQ